MRLYGYDGWPAHGGAGQPSSTVSGVRGRARRRGATVLAAAIGSQDRDQQPGRGRDDEAGAEHVQHHDGDGQAGEVLHEADDRLQHLDRRQGGDRPGVTAGGPEREPQPDGEADQQEHQVGVELADLQRVEPVARRARVAGVRARAGDHGAGVEHQPGDGVRRPGERRHAPRWPAATGGWSSRCRNSTATDTIASDSTRWSETTQGLRSVSTVMPPSTAWAGIASAARPTAAAGRAAERRALPGGDEGGHGDRDQHEGQGPVAELDELVRPDRRRAA